MTSLELKSYRARDQTPMLKNHHEKMKRALVDHQAKRPSCRGLVCPLQRGAVQCLGVDDHLATAVVDNQHPDGSAARIEGLLEAVIEVGLVKHWQGLLDVTSLGHGNNFRYIVSPELKQLLIGTRRTHHFRPGGRGRGIASGWVRAWSGQQRSGRGCGWTRTPHGVAW